jgi:PD-(D/E)XK nuclease superfamily protein
VNAPVTREELEAAQCWDPSDVVPRRPAMTEFRQLTRLHHARWREAHGHPIGTQPIKPRPGVDARLVGSRIPLPYARETGATFLTASALEAARKRTAAVEPQQSIDHQGLWADLLASEALAFNLFGDLAADLRRADRAIHAWMPDAPGRASEIRFAHSPGRLDPEWLNSLRAFDAAFVLDLDDGTHGIVGVDVKYHERLKAEQPKPENLWRYREVHERSSAFRPIAFDAVSGRSDLWHLWLEHLLLLSMLQHPSGQWSWGRYLFIYPSGNVDMADADARYRELLADDSTFDSMTLDDLIAANVLRATTASALRNRYLPGEP